MTPLRIFIGVDRRQPLAYTVARNSVERHAKSRVTVEPLRIDWLPIQRTGLTEFTYSRYIVPWLCDYQGVAIFLDGDMVLRADIHELIRNFSSDAAVGVVKNKQRFEWPSLMVFNCAHPKCAVLTPEFINDAGTSPNTLEWAGDAIGTLDPNWNHCVGYDTPNAAAKIIHYTAGIPCWPETENCEAAEVWRNELAHATSTVSWETLMGRSVHRHVVGK